MAVRVTYTEARRDLARLWDLAVQDRETIIISRRGADDVALIAADELASLLETVHRALEDHGPNASERR